EYHLYPLAAFASVLAFSEVEALVARRRVVLGGLVALSLLASGATLARRGHDTVAAGWVRDKEAVVTSLVDDLARRWTAADTIQVLDTTEGGVHALLRLGAQTPTRFLYDFHFFHDVRHPTIRGLRDELVRDLAARHDLLVTIEENVIAGGAGSAVLEALQRHAVTTPVIQLGLPDRFVDQGDPGIQIAECGLTADGIISAVRARVAG
ncbi:MAG TPA: transketolase C-terminal domain-containing protein, partial [Burkholderiales bacterium]|nr:transketolase C-terminal domain-containing protein [Burkholderiales bacterium]